ncbi:MAG: tRNA (adenosine(37)-N6)-threonylcarbamoyltransferase complex ATPase subunit type 1 TsaE [Oscillospiraceae bacterium]|nr:tRNA (adenosine(37)-N6)-threonylcarbamoyltransferase complex ATPase subunit type 1 TsaE [Oscillospiraceae bacterium]
MEKFVSSSEIETKKIAYKLASNLTTGDIIILSGDLGSGKTHFTKGLLSFWELEDEVSSPTFTIVNEHLTKRTITYIHIPF